MMIENKFSEILKIPGVDQYIFVDKKGNIAAHEINSPEKAAKAVHFCGKRSQAFGKDKLRCILFSRNNQKDLLIFPVGNYYLGVVKQESMNSIALADNIIKSLTDLQKKRS